MRVDWGFVAVGAMAGAASALVWQLLGAGKGWA